MNNARFIIIRGAPGTGKSVAARQLAAHFPNGATIEVDWIRRSMNGIIWHNHQQHFDAIHVMAAMAHAFVDRGYCPIVIVDTLGFGSLELALDALAAKSIGIYSLICDPLPLAIRLWRRSGGFRDIRKAQRFNAHIQSVANGGSEVINTASASPQRVCQRILELELGGGTDASLAQDSLR